MLFQPLPMRRILIIALLAPAVLTAPASAVTPRSSDAGARLLACHTSTAPLGRYLLAEAAMRRLPGTSRMQVRFDLYRRLPGRFTSYRVAGPGLGVYLSSAPGVLRYVYRRRVANLPVPGIYRLAVSHRWLDASGHVVASTVRYTGYCLQPDLRPDLQVVDVSAAPGDGSSTAEYLVTVHNAGRSTAGPFDVQVSVNGVDQPPAPVSGLLPGQTRTVSVAGAERCASGGAVVAAVDPDNRVAEALELNNRRFAACPSRSRQ